MTGLGPISEVAGRHREVRFTPESRLNSDIAACPKGANNGSRWAYALPHLTTKEQTSYWQNCAGPASLLSGEAERAPRICEGLLISPPDVNRRALAMMVKCCQRSMPTVMLRP